MKHQQRPAATQLKSRVESLEDRGHVHAAPVLLARAILGPATPLSGCQTCQKTLPEQIEAELNGRRGSGYRAIRRHLDLCPACEAIYLDLLETALLAEEGLLPRPPLVVDLSFLAKSLEREGKDV